MLKLRENQQSIKHMINMINCITLLYQTAAPNNQFKIMYLG